MSTTLSKFGAHLRRLRTHKGWTLREAAEQTAIPHTSLYQMESLGKDPRLSELEQLRVAYSFPSLSAFMRRITHNIALNGKPKRKK